MLRGVLAAMAALMLLGVPDAEPATFKIATVAPEGTTWMDEMRKGAAEIARRTDGRVMFKFYPGGVMGNDKSVMRKMRIGQLQGGALTAGELAGIFPNIQIYSIPLLFRNYEEVDYVRTRMDASLSEGLEKEGLVALGISEGGFVYLMCKKPIRRIDDMRDQKVWLPEGDVLARAVFDVVGVSPVSLPISDVYTGLQTGLVDTVGSPPMATIAFQWHTKLTHFTDAPLMYVVGALVVDKKDFDGLSPADQGTVREVMGGVFETLEKFNRRDNESAREALKKQGMVFVNPTEAEFEYWHHVAAEAVKRLLASGAFTEDFLNAVRQHLDTFRSTPAGP